MAVYLVLDAADGLFTVKIKADALNAVRRVLPAHVAGFGGNGCGDEMNQRITNYIRGKCWDGGGGRNLSLAGAFAVWPQLFHFTGNFGGLF